jgi:hypothetical protein
MSVITSMGMRETARRMQLGSVSQFICIAALSVHVPYRETDEWVKSYGDLNKELHDLLRRDGFETDGSWREQHQDERYYEFCDNKKAERIEWCLKIADELEAQGR